MKHVPYDISKLICWLFFRLGFGLEVRGQEHVPQHGAFIVAANHASFLDPPLIGAACPRRVRFMARADLYTRAWLAAYMRSVRCISVRRGEADLGAIRQVLQALRQGEPVAIFPEGGRQRDGQLGRAKRGVGLLAGLARMPVVPALIQGTFQAWPPGAARLSPSKIRVAFGPPIPYTDSPTSLSQSGQMAGRTSERPSRDHHEQLADAVTREWQRLARQLNG
ncbi:MAG: 1-acyl-sn-glycerol-3-phosphate acyltransferase [Candidatus Omnitrophica bacterium]|nr:1-acyl-sn-glycerol-3-phosphate acyltransferase [Candidatus Omnitrophota bacterium]